MFPSEDYMVNIIVEFHGLLFDLIFFGVILAIYDKVKSEKENVKRWKEELDDYRKWNEPEAGYKIKGLVTRLNNNGVTQIDLSKCSFIKTDLSNMTITDVEINNLNVQNSKIKWSFLNSTLILSDFKHSRLDFDFSKVLFRSCKFDKTHINLLGYISFESCTFNGGSFNLIEERHDRSYEYGTAFVKCHFNSFDPNTFSEENLDSYFFHNCTGLDFLDENGNRIGRNIPSRIERFGMSILRYTNINDLQSSRRVRP
tara:strand:- start:1878 stop:2645 length:768 start_codon:yes stop_codon:yes gene_type:complete